MGKAIVLDSAPVGLMSNPARTPEVIALLQRAIDWENAGAEIILPEIVDYEVRRELLRAQKSVGVQELDNLKARCRYLPLTTAAMLTAADLWAQTRQKGLPTAPDENIDVDVILAAQVLTAGLPLAETVVATANLRHLSRFVNADLWRNIIL